MLNVNVLALCIATREAIALIKSSGVEDGHIININSMSDHNVYRPFYSATNRTFYHKTLFTLVKRISKKITTSARFDMKFSMI